MSDPTEPLTADFAAHLIHPEHDAEKMAIRDALQQRDDIIAALRQQAATRDTLLRDCIQALREMEWQPIENAPLDRTLVIIGFFRPNVFETSDGKPQSWCTLGKSVADDPPPLTPSAWRSTFGQGFTWPPTHYMSLPPILDKENAVAALLERYRKMGGEG